MFRSLSPTESLLLVFALLYLLEGLIWVPAGRMLFAWGTFGGRSRARRRFPFLENRSGGLCWGTLLPFGAAATAHEPAFQLSQAGMVLADTPGLDREFAKGTFLPYSPSLLFDVRDKQIRTGDTLVDTMPTEAMAAARAQQLAQIRDASAQKRPAAIRDFNNSIWDAEAVREQVERFRDRSFWTTSFSLLMMLQAFVIGPIKLYTLRPGHDPDWELLQFLGVFLFLWWMTILSFYLAHRRLYPARWASRLATACVMLIYAPHAMRASLILSRPLLEPYSPLAVSAALSSKQEFQRIAREQYLSWLHLPQHESPELQTALEDLQQAALARTKNLVKGAGLEPAFLDAPPPQDFHSVAYCPRCDEQFTHADACCDRCQMPLRLFETAAAATQTRDKEDAEGNA